MERRALRRLRLIFQTVEGFADSKKTAIRREQKPTSERKKLEGEGQLAFDFNK
jgi:hypothetical protein